MKILLIGEYSNVHATLAEGLKAIGHSVTVVSNGDFWKNYPRDISLVRHPSKLGGIVYMAKLYSILPRLRGYDVVQLINPMFLEIKAERIFAIYRYLRLRLWYPEKFWKLANQYYNSRKSCISWKNAEKLEKLFGQQKQRIKFLKTLE